MIPEALIRGYAAESWAQPPVFELPLPDLRGEVVLDLCGGPGVYTRALIERGARRVVWYDGSCTLQSIAREKLVGLSGIELITGEMMDLSAWSEGEFDGVFFRDALHHALDEARVFREIARVLKPGGWLYLLFPTIRRISAASSRFRALAHLPVVALGVISNRKPRATLFSSRRAVRRDLRRAGISSLTAKDSGAYHVIFARREQR